MDVLAREISHMEQRLRDALALKTNFGSNTKQQQHLTNCFKRFDYDGDNGLAKVEFQKALETMNFVLRPALLDAMFDKWDSDQSGTIDFKEFVQGLYRTPLQKSSLGSAPSGDVITNDKSRGPTARPRTAMTDRDRRTREERLVVKSATDEALGRRGLVAGRGYEVEPKRPARARAPDTEFSAPSESEFGQLVLAHFRKKLTERGSIHGIGSLGVVFRSFDNNRDRKVSEQEFRDGLSDFGIKIKPHDVSILFQVIDRHHDGTIDFDEFMYAIRGEINDFRKELIMRAFRILDKTGDGMVTVEDLAEVYKTSSHPLVKAGKMSHEQCLREFMRQWDTIEEDGIVSPNEFLEYYKNVSASIDDDKYFKVMIENAWHMEGSDTQERVYVLHTDGTEEIVTLKNAMGLDLSNQRVLMGLLQRQGVKDIKKATKQGYAEK